MKLTMFEKLLSIATCCMLTVMVNLANAGIILDDNFDRPDGSLVGTNPTPGPGGVWTNHSGTVGDLLISGGKALIQHGVPSEDANSSFGNFSTGVLTAVFDIIVNDDTPISGGDYEYFAHFSDGGTSLFRARLDVVNPSSTGDYTLGISSAGGTAETVFPTDFDFGDTVSVALSFDFSTGLTSLVIGATTITSTVPALGDILSAFALRQSDSSNNESILLDNLVVSSIPEPGTLALFSLAGLAFVGSTRRRS